MNHIYASIDLQATGINFEKMRIERGYSVKDIQMFLGLDTPQSIYKWQKGRTLPTIDNLLAISFLFQVRIEDILVYKIVLHN